MTNPAKRARWRELIATWHSSDQGVAEFCRCNQLPIHQFYYWRDRVDAEPSACGSRLVPVVVQRDVSPAQSVAPVHARLPNGVELQLPTCALDQWLPSLAAL